jgi:hypothetical protein
LLLVVYLVIVAVTGTRVPGWASQMILLSVFFGVQFSLMAIVGEYLNRIYTESMRRPLYFVSADTAEEPRGPWASRRSQQGHRSARSD